MPDSSLSQNAKVWVVADRGNYRVRGRKQIVLAKEKVVVDQRKGAKSENDKSAISDANSVRLGPLILTLGNRWQAYSPQQFMTILLLNTISSQLTQKNTQYCLFLGMVEAEDQKRKVYIINKSTTLCSHRDRIQLLILKYGLCILTFSPSMQRRA